MSKQNEQEIYYIPPNFIEGGTLLGGMIRLRNAIEAAAISAVFGIPICTLNLSLTTKIILLCLIVLPSAIFALIGVAGESLSSFVCNFFVFIKNRRIIEKKTQEIKKDSPVEENTDETAETDCYRW